MHKVTVRAPVRADLAGGTLDLWPIYLFHPGSRTVNVAISYYAESEISDQASGAIEIHLVDQQYKQRYESLQEVAADPKAALLFRAIEHFKLFGLRITTRTDAPRGSGLGGSSALAITLVRALSEMAGHPLDGEELINLVKDLETRLLGVPAGIQDYYPPVFGGLGSLHLSAGKPARHALSTPIHDLASHFVLHYTGIAHFSGTNNWELYKRQIEGKKKVQKGFARIAEIAIEMEKALETSNYAAAGAALQKEWEARKALIDGISTPEIEAAVTAALGAGAWGGKVCGAGGGGCIVFLTPPEKREDVIRALASVPGRVLDAQPVQHGMTVDVESDMHPTLPFPRARLQTQRGGTSIEQLYVYGGSGGGAYRPYVLAEGIVTHSESRSGVHHAIARSYMAPMQQADAKVLWHLASPVDAGTLDLRAVPDPTQRMEVTVSPETLMQSASQSQEGFRRYLEETERLQIFHNAAFGLYSDPNETREQFLQRCFDEAKRLLGNKQERLESTFRRRIDQLRERSDRERREREEEQGSQHDQGREMNVAWGQALYNITSGRPTGAVADAPRSARDVDYLDNIAQIQRTWDRELQGLREELDQKAREIEEMTLAPAAKNIEVTRFLILWAAGVPPTQ